MVVVRQPVKSVLDADRADPLPVRLAIGVISAIGVIAVVWLLGYLGYRLGFAKLVNVPELVGHPGNGFLTGVLMLIGVPGVILEAGIEQPMWLMAGFALIALPAAGLSSARSYPRGGPRIPKPVQVIAYTGAVFAGLNAIALLWWTISSFRLGLVQGLPSEPAGGAQWLANLEIVAGLDVLAVIVAALWVVLSLRLPVAVWAKSLAATVSMFALVVVAVAMSITNASVAQATMPRSLCMLGDETGGLRLLMGTTPQHTVTLVIYDDSETFMELRNHPDAILVRGRQSLASFLDAAAADDALTP